MKLRHAVFSLVLILALAVSACALTKGSYKNIDFEAAQAQATQSGAFSLVGTVHIKSVDKVAKTTVEATASKVNITFLPSSKGQSANKSGFSSVDNATMSGPVKIVHTAVDAEGNTVRTTATADNARYDGKDQLAHLIGNVKIVYDNPAKDEEPSVLTGEKATVSLRPNLGPDDVRFSVESSSDFSTAEFPLKPKAKQGTK